MTSSKESATFIDHSVATTPLRYEIWRKIIHVVSLAIPIGYTLFGKSLVLWALGAGLVIACATEILRQHWAGFARVFNSIFGKLLREFEIRKLTGATYLLVGVFLTILFFPKPVALFSLYMVILSDSLSALVGLTRGRMRFLGKKSVEGCLAFLLSAMAIGFFVVNLNPWLVLLGAVVGMIFELDLIPINDNLLIPVGTAAVMEVALRLWG